MQHVSHWYGKDESMIEEQRPVAVGDAAPDVTLRDENGEAAALSVYWQRQPAVLVFVRHFG
jgi:peroxiredoxin